MALIDDVQARYSAARLTQLTNPDVTTAVTPDLVRLQASCDDAEGWFSAAAGKSYTEAAASTITGEAASARGAAVAVVMAFLYQYRGLPGEQPVNDAWQAAQKLVSKYARQFGGLQWIAPITDSVVQPSVQNPTVPDFDPTRNTRWVPRDPPAAQSDSSNGFGSGF